MPENEADTRFYSRYYPRRLMAEVLLDAYSQVTGVPTEFQHRHAQRRTRASATTTRGLARAAAARLQHRLAISSRRFGRPEREMTCECERTAEPSMAQVLHIANGDTLNQKLAAKDNAVAKLLAANKADAQIIDEAYLTCLARHPPRGAHEALRSSEGLQRRRTPRGGRSLLGAAEQPGVSVQSLRLDGAMLRAGIRIEPERRAEALCAGMRIAVQLAVLWIGWLVLPVQAVVTRFDRFPLYGTEYIRLDDWARANGYQFQWVVPREEVRHYNAGGHASILGGFAEDVAQGRQRLAGRSRR